MTTQFVQGFLTSHIAMTLGGHKCLENLYAVFADGTILVCSNVVCPNPHFDAKGREWHAVAALPKDAEYIGTYAAPKATVIQARDLSHEPIVPYDC